MSRVSFTSLFRCFPKKSQAARLLLSAGLLVSSLPSTGCTNHGSPQTSSASQAVNDQTSPPTTRLLAFLAWGSAADQVGRLVPKEGAPEAPMSFDMAPDGRMAVLDQVNQRILLLDAKGKPERFLPLPGPTYQDLRLLDEGAVAVMDRLKRREILVLSPSGAVLGKTPLEGPFVKEGGGVTALLSQPDGLWVEVEHRYSVLVADRKGRPVRLRIRRTGRVLGDRAARLWRNDPTHATLAIAPLGAGTDRETSIALAYPEPIRLTGLVRLSDGGFAVSAQSTDRPSPQAPMDRLYVDFIDASGGRLVSRWSSAIPAMAEETFQTLRPGPRGGITLLHLEKQGLVVQEVRP